MKENEKTQFSFTLDRSEKESLECAAKEMGLSLTELLKTGAFFYSNLDPAFRKRVETFSRNLGIQEYLVLQNIAISWMARREAEAKVLGGEAEPILLEFTFTENGPVTGDELHATLLSDFIRRYENQRENALRLKKESGGILNKEQAAWLKNRK